LPQAVLCTAEMLGTAYILCEIQIEIIPILILFG